MKNQPVVKDTVGTTPSGGYGVESAMLGEEPNIRRIAGTDLPDISNVGPRGWSKWNIENGDFRFTDPEKMETRFI